MFVSIIIPIFNAAPYLSRCLDSVLKQTYTGKMECIFVDDCGTDQSMTIVQQVIDQYQGSISFLHIAHTQNQGLSAARNSGIKYSRGNYLYFLDADDWIEPYCIASLVAMAQRYPGVEMIQAGAIAHGGGTKPWLNMQDSSLPEYTQGLEYVKPLMLNRSLVPVTSWNRLIKKDFLISHHLLFQEGLIHEDELWTYHLATCLTSLAILKQNTYHYEYHESGLMAKASTQKSASLAVIARQMITGIDDCCQGKTVSYIADFIQLRSFDIPEEPYRIAFLNVLPSLYPYFSFIRRLSARIWYTLAKLPIRDHYWLYTLLYHWKI